MTTEDLMKLADKFAFFMPGSEEGEKARQALLDALEAPGREVAELKETYDRHTNALSHDCEALRAELAAIRAQGAAEDLSFMEFMDAEDAMFEQIDIAARKSFRRHQSSVKGQMFTRADGFDSHLVWAALDWAKKHNASPASKDAGLVAALKDAATSLETISRLAGRTHYVGDDGERVETYMGHHDQVRGYATSRASVARNALSKIGGV